MISGQDSVNNPPRCTARASVRRNCRAGVVLGLVLLVLHVGANPLAKGDDHSVASNELPTAIVKLCSKQGVGSYR